MNAPLVQSVSGATLENLYPALTKCFAIIISGYFAGRMNLISETEGKGISTFVGTFALPSLIFMSLAQLDLTSVNWLFLLSILIAKSVVFFSVTVITLLVGRPVNYGRAGIFAIFCTQSNDFAIGYPIVAALYKNSHPDYASYLYLIAPINLAILNPISFVFMEIGCRRSASDAIFSDGEVTSISIYKQRLKMVVSVMKNIFLNPIVFMTILGILGNFVFKHSIPCYLGEVLDSLGSAFSASALFLLGLRMVGKVHQLRGATLVVPGILIMAKLIVFPLVTREVVSLIHPSSNYSETVDLSTYGFLYGTFPTAPSVFVFATQYAIDVDLIASAMVACTFISAPLMFVSAKMITLTKTDPSKYLKELDAFSLDVSIVAVIACCWVLFVFVLTKKIMRVPHKITACLIISQMVSCLGAIFWNTLQEKDNWAGYFQSSLFITGVYSTRLWTTILAVTLVFLQCRSLCYVLKLQPLFFLIGWGIPIVTSVLLLMFEDMKRLPMDKRNPNFEYGTPQAIIAVSLLVLCFIVTVGCLILQQRYDRLFTRYLDLTSDISDPQISSGSSNEVETNIEHPSTSAENGGHAQKNHMCGALPTINEGCCEESPVVDIEDLFTHSSSDLKNLLPITENEGEEGLCPSRFGCQGPKRHQCQGIVRQYQEQIDDDLEFIEEEPESHEPQFLRHTVLLILLLCSMFVGLALSIWTLVMEQISGIYVELSFLDATLNFGQSIIVFSIFGLDLKEVALPLLKLKRLLWHGANTLVLPSWDELSAETRHICDQFVTHHLQSCRGAIAADKRWRIKIYKSVFTGQRFVDWLIEVGLARDRGEAVNYARHLIEGKVLRHINGVYHFYDRNLLYTFV